MEGRGMMGERQARQEALFYGFNLERMCLLITCCVRFIASSNWLASGGIWNPFYSAVGRPSADPELIIRLLLISYCCGIRSEQRLCERRRIRRPS
jgi:hypothetical protein